MYSTELARFAVNEVHITLWMLCMASSSLLLLTWIALRRQSTHLRASERERLQLRARYAQLTSSRVLGLMIWDDHHQLVEVNDALLHMTGATRERLQRSGVRDDSLTPAAWLRRNGAAQAQLVNRGATDPWEERLVREDGAPVHLLVSVALSQPSREYLACVVERSDKPQSEHTARASEPAQGVDATARLAGGLGHDFNNLLTIILGRCEVLMQRLTPDAQRDLLEIEHAAQRAANLTRQLVAFSRRQPMPTPAGDTVLIVDDETLVRKLVSKLLQHEGYAVLEAESALEALEICRSDPREIHLLLTDVVMPACSGPELVARARPLRPGMKVLYISGCAIDALPEHGVLDPGVPYLQKPFTSQVLGRKVREVLRPAYFCAPENKNVA